MTTDISAMLAAVKEMGALAPAPQPVVKKQDEFKWVDRGDFEDAAEIMERVMKFFDDDEDTAAMKKAKRLEAQSRARAKAADIAAPLYDGML